jgi:zona occludens toxin (predicted ATPase)
LAAEAEVVQVTGVTEVAEVADQREVAAVAVAAGVAAVVLHLLVVAAVAAVVWRHPVVVVVVAVVDPSYRRCRRMHTDCLGTMASYIYLLFAGSCVFVAPTNDSNFENRFVSFVFDE